ncbi:MAG: beta-ACP synthase [Helicobacter sp.]|nr:beta-ACP synthase [Helicobacter sp.]
MKTYINAFGGICSAGLNPKEIISNIQKNTPKIEKLNYENKEFMLAKINELKDLPLKTPKKFRTRTNQVLYTAILQIYSMIQNFINEFGKDRIGVVIGTTTTGVEESYKDLENFKLDLFKERNSLSNPANFLANLLGLESLRFGISSACTSGIKALIEAQRLLEYDLCDAVICGGVDSLNSLTIFGFDSLEILSSDFCLPFSKNRKGINLGEGAAVFLLSRKPSKLYIKGYASNNDAYHITKPNVSYSSQKDAILQALNQANLTFDKIDYINLHGTGTISNDDMEARLIDELFKMIPCSSTKSIMGHTLGAAGALEAMICLQILKESLEQESVELPIHCYDKFYDENMPKINLVCQKQKTKVYNALSLSFAFGGDNSAVILGVKD